MTKLLFFEKKRRSLIRLGIEAGQVYAWSRTQKGGWAVAQSPILITTITLERLKKRGYVSMSKIVFTGTVLCMKRSV
ncbi:hypothetical protein L3049_06140 [Labilibaculum sp. DW002]|uniref:Uncharacterized protein n=1 Tax=Paralabilibaculum antarcticum TaxID=2912572 RepID=A0ABT5VSU0_9BACT|nr:hypothetical protein [Labilibaculum sp. DW002]MDE5417583.1 hypothetical protein [Labilibaculum sp. DW002]